MPSKVAFLSDIHGNSPALQAVLDDIQGEKCTEVFMLGDVINGIDPQGCLQLLRTWSDGTGVKLSCIKGNAEAYLMTPDLDSLPRRDEAWNIEMMNLIQWFQDDLSGSDLEWIDSFPETLRWKDAYFVHDSPMDRLTVQTQNNPEIKPQYRDWFYHGRGIGPNMTEQEWMKLLEFMDSENIRQVFSGHTHVPFYKEIGNKVICNVGSVCAPVDGDPRSSWVMLTDESGGNQVISMRRVAYEVPLIHRLIDQTPDYPDFNNQGFREAYKQWFLTGVHWKAHI